MRRLLRTLLDLFVGALCATAWPLAIVAVGFCETSARRRVLQSLASKGDPLPSERARWLRGSLLRNLRQGVAVLVNTWVLTLPAGLLWWFAWQQGWNLSFYKSYEEFGTGAATASIATLLFATAMLYVPIALSLQATTQDWRDFYRGRIVGRVIASAPGSIALLALCFAVLGLPVAAMKSAPIFFDRFSWYSGASDVELRAVLDRYFFWAGGFVFAAYWWLRRRAATVFAVGLRAALRRGSLSREALPERLRALLGATELEPEAPATSPTMAFAQGGLRSLWVGTTIGLALLVWLGFCAQIFVSEFLNYHGAQGWLNQPLVHLPWFRYLPPGLSS